MNEMTAVENRLKTIIRLEVVIVSIMSIGTVFAFLVLLLSWYGTTLVVKEVQHNRDVLRVVVERTGPDKREVK